jgi:hypothetical protein
MTGVWRSAARKLNPRVKGEAKMKRRKRLILGMVLFVCVSGGLTTWALGRAAANGRKAPQTKYLTAFFEKYFSALNSHGALTTEPFYTPDAVTVGAWGIEKNNAERLAYEAGCGSALPAAAFTVKSLKIEPATETSGTITWEFGIKSGKQVAPFLGVDGHYEGSDPNDPNAPFDQEGVSIGEVGQQVDATTQSNIDSLQQRIAALDDALKVLDANIVTESGAQRDASLASKNDVMGQRAALDQTLTDTVVSTIKFTRQSSYQNMDKFLKKLAGE